MIVQSHFDLDIELLGQIRRRRCGGGNVGITTTTAAATATTTVIGIAIVGSSGGLLQSCGYSNWRQGETKRDAHTTTTTTRE